MPHGWRKPAPTPSRANLEALALWAGFSDAFVLCFNGNRYDWFVRFLKHRGVVNRSSCTELRQLGFRVTHDGLLLEINPPSDTNATLP